MLYTRTKPSTCECGHRLDAITSCYGDNTLRPGYLTVCLYCLRINRFNPDMSLSALTARELKRLPSETRSQLENVRRILLLAKNSN